jgi:urease accessory protein
MNPHRVLLIVVCLLVSSPAFAHSGHSTADFASGFTHPFGGIDHVLAMVAVGLLAATLGGRALWAVPAAFVTMMVVGGALGFARVQLPGTEIGIAVSIVVLGALMMFGWPRSGTGKRAISSVVAVAGAFAVAHGYAHGSEMPAASHAAAYMIGFVCSTVILHGLGMVTGLTVFARPGIARMTGTAITTWGLVILFT